MTSLPRLFRRPRWLIVGAGDVGQRVIRDMAPRVKLVALTSSPHRQAALFRQGAVPMLGNLDDPASLRRVGRLASRVLHLAPPPPEGRSDPRTRALIQALARGHTPQVLVYGSTSGVYGDCGGALIDETRAYGATTPRAQRRVDAETALRAFGARGGARGAKRRGTRVSILRIPGIYAPDRPDGTPEPRLHARTPVLHAAEDVFTNHIHADDLAQACIAALWRGAPQRAYHVNDDAQWRMGEYFDRAAALYGLAPAPRISRAQAQTELSPMRLSFMNESRRLDNRRMKRELKVRLRYATPMEGLLA
jgi:nucleoside-diphosphate-sugar epimerase